MIRLGVVFLSFVAVSFFPPIDAAGDSVECTMTATAPSGVLFTCPQGDGDRLEQVGLTVHVTLYALNLQPAPDVSADCIWLETCNGQLSACGEGGKIHASAPTDANGQTTITGRFIAGGTDFSGVRVVVNIDIGGPIPLNIHCESQCFGIKVKSPDLNGDLAVNLIDFSSFGGPSGYPSPPKQYNEIMDFVAPFGTVTLADFAKFAAHVSHHC